MIFIVWPQNLYDESDSLKHEKVSNTLRRQEFRYIRSYVRCRLIRHNIFLRRSQESVNFNAYEPELMKSHSSVSFPCAAARV